MIVSIVNHCQNKQGFLLVGLGNPGKKYANTRHNVGFLALDELAHRWKFNFTNWQKLALIAKGTFQEIPVTLAKPLTYMNLSGDAVQSLLSYYSFPHNNLLVISDDVNLVLGKLRMRKKGSAGGHHGLLSIIESIGTNIFSRLRIGIQSALVLEKKSEQLEDEALPKDLTQYVLGNFTSEERVQLKDIIKNACDAVEIFLLNGIETAMNKYN